MDELLRRLAANGFADLEGLQVTGTLPVRQDIVNDILADVVRTQQAGGAAGTPGTATKPNPAGEGVNWWKLVSRLQVRLTEGRAHIDFELRR